MNQEKTMMKHNTKNIVEALSKFQDEANVAKKESKNPFFKSTYAALEDVIAAANQGAKFGLAFTQTIDYEKQVIDGVIDTTMYLTTTLMHGASDAAIKSRYLIVPKNNNYADSQALGSAITYAKRYSLQAIYGLPSEDDDGNATQVDKSKVDDLVKWKDYARTQVRGMQTIAKDKDMDKEKKLAMLEEQENNQLNSWNNLKLVDEATHGLMMKQFEKIKKELVNV
jgi:hypothetical protein